MISQQILKILTPLQKLPKNLGKQFVATGFWKVAQSQKNAQSGHTACSLLGKAKIPVCDEFLSLNIMYHVDVIKFELKLLVTSLWAECKYWKVIHSLNFKTFYSLIN